MPYRNISDQRGLGGDNRSRLSIASQPTDTADTGLLVVTGASDDVDTSVVEPMLGCTTTDGGGASTSDTGDTMMLRLGGTTSEVSLSDLTLEVRPPRDLSSAAPVSWRWIVAVLDPWPHQGTAARCRAGGRMRRDVGTWGRCGSSAYRGAVEAGRGIK